jgi:hypothetical protein
MPRAGIFNNSDTTSNGWVELTWHPTHDDENAGIPDQFTSGLEFTRHTGSSISGSNNMASELVIAWDGSAVQDIEVEAWAIYEMCGNLVAGKSLYARDAEAWGFAATAISQIKARAGDHENERDEGSKIADYVRMAGSAAAMVVPLALNAAEMLFPGITGPAVALGNAIQ